jgi:Xaa-Pro aminopeptidase
MNESTVYSDRMSRVREKIKGLGLEAIVFLDMQNIRYLTGFTGSEGALLAGDQNPVLLVDGRYTTQAGREVQGADIRQYRDKTEGIVQAIRDGGWKGVGLESAALILQDYLKLKERASEVEWKALGAELNTLRMIKDERETGCIQKAAALSSQALCSLLDTLKPGMTEKDVALELECRIRRRGADRVSFDVIVASGENSALPHARPGTRPFKEGDFIVFDYGGVCGGYCSDETCTVALGKASARQREVYDIVREAHDRALAAVRAGVSCRDVDHAARSYIEGKGLGQYFSHGTGHGIGLSVHEEPRLSTLSESCLEAGMVITIEPGVYLPGLWGIRIEDTVRVTSEGCDVLTKVPKDLKEVS